MKEFFQSSEVKRSKKVLGISFILAYLIFPFDLIPDYLVFFGILDDLMLATFVLERMVYLAPPSLKQKYQL